MKLVNALVEEKIKQMSNHKLFLPRLLFLGIFIILIVAFRLTIMNYLVGPIASVFWLFWRVLTSVNQNVYWSLIIFVFIILLFCLIPFKSRIAQPDEDEESGQGEPVHPFEPWHSLIAKASTDNSANDSLRRNLLNLLVDVVAHVERTSPLIAHEDLISKKVPLPPHIYLYIHPYEVKRKLSVRQWIRKWRGQRTLINHEEFIDTLKWIETYLEKKHEN